MRKEIYSFKFKHIAGNPEKIEDNAAIAINGLTRLIRDSAYEMTLPTDYKLTIQQEKDQTLTLNLELTYKIDSLELKPIELALIIEAVSTELTSSVDHDIEIICDCLETWKFGTHSTSTKPKKTKPSPIFDHMLQEERKNAKAKLEKLKSSAKYSLQEKSSEETTSREDHSQALLALIFHQALSLDHRRKYTFKNPCSKKTGKTFFDGIQTILRETRLADARSVTYFTPTEADRDEAKQMKADCIRMVHLLLGINLQETDSWTSDILGHIPYEYRLRSTLIPKYYPNIKSSGMDDIYEHIKKLREEYIEGKRHSIKLIKIEALLAYKALSTLGLSHDEILTQIETYSHENGTKHFSGLLAKRSRTGRIIKALGRKIVDEKSSRATTYESRYARY